MHFFPGVSSRITLGKVTPKLQISDIGATVSFTCFSETEPTWLKDRYIILVVSKYVAISVAVRGDPLEHTITLSNLQQSDSGFYNCVGVKSGKKFIVTTQLIVAGW